MGPGCVDGPDGLKGRMGCAALWPQAAYLTVVEQIHMPEINVRISRTKEKLILRIMSNFFNFRGATSLPLHAYYFFKLQEKALRVMSVTMAFSMRMAMPMSMALAMWISIISTMSMSIPLVLWHSPCAR